MALATVPFTLSASHIHPTGSGVVSADDVKKERDAEEDQDAAEQAADDGQRVAQLVVQEDGDQDRQEGEAAEGDHDQALDLGAVIRASEPHGQDDEDEQAGELVVQSEGEHLVDATVVDAEFRHAAG